MLVINGGRNEIILLKFDCSNKTVTTKREGVSEDVAAGVRQNTKVSDLHVLLRQADVIKRRDWLAANDEKKDPIIEMATLPVLIAANLEEIVLKETLEAMGAG